MNSDARRVYRHYHSYNDPDFYPHYYSTGGLYDRLVNSSTLVPVLVLLVTILYQLKKELFHKVLYTGRRSLSAFPGMALGTKVAGEHPEPPGLGNLNNSCYQNSILQGLASLKPLPTYLSAILPGVNDGPPTLRTVDALRDFLDELNDPANNGRTLWTPQALKSMDSWQQQDAHEYFSKVLDAVDKDISKAAKQLRRAPSCDLEVRNDDGAASQHSEDSGYQSLLNSKSSLDALRVRNPLEGLIAQRVACVSCGACEGLSTIPFNCLTLNLGVGSTQHDLGERLDNYTKVEEINGVECAKCSLLKAQSTIRQILDFKPDGYPELRQRLATIDEALEDDAFDEKTLEKCKISPQKRVTSTKTKQAVIARPPRSLAVHMNRSVFDDRTGHMYKNLAPVHFPMSFDLGPWCLGSAGTHDEPAADGEGSGSQNEEQWLVHPLASMAAGSLRLSKIKGPIYELRAVVTHFGAHESGHYVCYRRTMPLPRSGKESLEEKPPQLAAEGHDGPEDEGVSTANGEAPADKEELHAETEAASKLNETEDPIVAEEPQPQWWRISDEDVYPVDETVVLRQADGVFMLFYDCIDPSSALATDADSDTDGDIEVSHVESGDKNVPAPDDTDVDATAQQPVLIGSMMELMMGSVEGAMMGNLEGSMVKLAVGDDVASRAAMVPLPQDGVC